MNDTRGSRPGREWLIKTEDGKQTGPFDTATVLGMISDGSFVGTELIKKYPDGKWLAISKEPEFYDRLLEALEESRTPHRHKINLNQIRPQAKPQVTPESKVPDLAKALADARIQREPEPAPPQENQWYTPQPIPASTPVMPKSAARPIKSERRSAGNKNSRLPIIFFLLAAIVGGFAYLWEPEQKVGNEKPNLLIPRESNSATLSGPEVKESIQKAVSEYVKDTYESYNEAQKVLVRVIEGAPQNTEARGTLCLVYKELWPFVKQDSADMAAVSAISRSARSLDPIGIQGVYCEVVKLMTQGKYTEARGMVEYSLNQPAMASAPVLFALKAEILFEDRETLAAVQYAEKSAQLWPEWVKPVFDRGRFLAKTDQYAESQKSLLAALRMNPKHKLAQIELGISLFKGSQQTDEGIRLLTAALESPGKLSKIDESRANFFVALMFADKKDSVQAKKYAQRAYRLNSGDAQNRDLYVRLGGQLDANAGDKNSELVFLGDQHARTGNWLAAQAEYKAAYDLDPTNAVAALKAAQSLWQMSQTNEAVSWLSKAIKADDKLIAAYVLLADYLSARFNYSDAIQILSRASKIFPNNNEVLRGYGLVEFRRNNVRDALSYLQRAYKIYENDIDTLVLLAKAHSANADYTSAQKYAIRAIELDATNKEAQIVYANILTQFQGVETGVVYLKDLINKFSYTLDFRLGLADLYKENERHSDAQKIYEQILDADPKNKSALLGLGETFQAQAQLDKALKSYLAAAVLDPSDAEPLFRAALAYIDASKYSEAVAQLQRAKAINPLFPRLNYYIGQAYFQNNEFDKALQASQDERKINPNLADSYILAAEIYAATRNFQKCTTEYQQAVKLRPKGADLYVKMARCYRQAGNPDIAENMLNIAASQESGWPDIYKEQGAVYEVKGDIRSAVQAYNKYLTLSPNAPDRKEIEGRILSIGSGN